MSKITDPDDLDRWQICIDPAAETISLRGLGAARSAMSQTGDGDGTTTFTDLGANFTGDGVSVGDVLTIISDPAEDGGIIGHYRVTGAITATTFEVGRAIGASASANLTYRVDQPQTPGALTPQVSDGVNKQVLFSFLKEEWITLSAGLGNAVDLNRFDFPIVAISSAAGQYIMGGVNGDASSAWRYADLNGTLATDVEGVPRELVRDGGWQERDASNIVLREYANYTTLGTLDTDAQAYYQQGDEAGTPFDFKLLGPVNQAIITFGPDSGPHGGGLAFAATTVTRGSGSWLDDGFQLGDYVAIREAEDAGNVGSFGPISSLSATVITIATASFTVNASDTAAILQPDHRRYTKLFARKKGRTYTSAVHEDAGIPATGILPLINKFPLSHGNDPAIVLDDGVLSGGDGTAEGNVFQQVETHTTAADGVTTDLGDGTFTFSSASAAFDTQARSLDVLSPGDSLEITSGNYQGVYEILSVDSTTQVTCFHEPLRVYPGNETTLGYTARTGVRDTGAANATLADVDGDTGTLTSAGSTFAADDGLGDRIAQAGDVVEVYAGDAAVIGYYRVVSVDSATQLTLATGDQPFSGETNQTYRIWRPGMFLQRFEALAVASGMSTLDIDGAGDPDTLTRTGGSWVTDGFTDGMAFTIAAAEDPANVGTFIIDTVTALALTLIAEESLTTNVDDTVAINGALTGDTGIVRTINGVDYPFHWRLFANGATLGQCHQFLSRELRRATDIDGGTGLSRGDITDLLMTFVSPNGVTLDLFPDNLSTTELNNVTYTDVSGEARNNAFLVGLIFDVNVNLISSAFKRLTAYFLSVPSGDFGSNTAVIVDDADGVDMDFTTILDDIQTTFDYTNNSQGGRAPGTDAAIIVVALGTDLAQHILVTQLITRVNSITVSVQPNLERNYTT